MVRYNRNTEPEVSTGDLLENLTKGIEQRIGGVETESRIPFYDWVMKSNLVVEGKKFTFKGHEYLIEPYKDDHPYVVEIKAAQLGLTTKAILLTAYEARYFGYAGILYLFPTRTDVSELSKGKIDTIFKQNPDTIGKWLQETDTANVKKIWNTVVYFRGMKSKVSLKSVTVDRVIYDELDEAPQNMVKMAMHRMAHSEFKRVLQLSNPTLPDYGIDLAYQETDQRKFLIKCRSCGHHTDMIDSWTALMGVRDRTLLPDCFREKNGEFFRICQKCHRKIDISHGEWVAAKPSIKVKRGYHYSQLFSSFVSAKEIVDEFRAIKRASEASTFWNLCIGVAFIEAENRLSEEEVLALCGDEGILSSNKGPCSMGVDQGKGLHVVIGRALPKPKIIHIGIYKEWEELDGLMNNFNVSRCVVDGQPETRNARDFGMRHPGRVYLSFYNEYQRNGYAWDEGEMKVVSNRTESLDASHQEIQGKSKRDKGFLPRQCEVVELFAKHLHSVGKKLEEDEVTGSKRYTYVKLGREDHFRHAFSFECMARQFAAGLLFPEML